MVHIVVFVDRNRRCTQCNRPLINPEYFTRINRSLCDANNGVLKLRSCVGVCGTRPCTGARQVRTIILSSSLILYEYPHAFSRQYAINDLMSAQSNVCGCRDVTFFKCILITTMTVEIAGFVNYLAGEF